MKLRNVAFDSTTIQLVIAAHEVAEQWENIIEVCKEAISSKLSMDLNTFRVGLDAATRTDDFDAFGFELKQLMYETAKSASEEQIETVFNEIAMFAFQRAPVAASEHVQDNERYLQKVSGQLRSPYDSKGNFVGTIPSTSAMPLMSEGTLRKRAKTDIRSS